MFKELRRSDGNLSDAELLEILVEAKYGVLSTVGEDGHPYGVPANFVYHENNIYFHCATEGHKLDNIGHNNKVSFSLVKDVKVLPASFSTNYCSVVAFGTASELTEVDQKKEIIVKIIEKYSKGFLEDGTKYIESSSYKVKVYQIEIEHITAKGRKAPWVV